MKELYKYLKFFLIYTTQHPMCLRVETIYNVHNIEKVVLPYLSFLAFPSLPGLNRSIQLVEL